MPICSSNLIRTLCLIAILSSVSLAIAQNSPKPSDGAKAPDESGNPAPVTAEQLQQLLKRIESLESEVRNLKQSSLIPKDPKQQRVAVVIETPYFGSPTYYSSRNNKRLFVAKLVLINLTDKQVDLEIDKFTLTFDDSKHQPKPIPSNFTNYPVQIANQTIYLKNIKPLKKVSIPAGSARTTWITYADLPSGNDVPKLSLQIPVGNAAQVVDINGISRERLRLTAERIGPSNSLGLLSVSGELDSVNAGVLVAELEKLAQQRVARAIIRWNDSAATADTRIVSWLTQAAMNAGTGRVVNNMFPSIPSSFRELHLAAIPTRSTSTTRTSYSSSSTAAKTTHKTVEDAIAAALGSAYEVLSRDALLNEIKSGHALTRPAALAIGGGRLAAEDLPLILKFADDSDPKMQSAAIKALRHFGEQAAIDMLLKYLLRNKAPLSMLAAESLAGSRFESANLALLKVMQKDTVSNRRDLIGVLSKHARPIWSETLYKFYADQNSSVRVDALKALIQTGHPKLFEVLKESLKSSNAQLNGAAFQALVNRTDPESEAVAIEHTLKHMEKSAPTAVMTTLLNRTKHAAAVPLLLKHLNNSSVSRITIINTLGTIGDSSVVAELSRRFSKFKNSEQAAVMTAMTKLDSAEFLKLAAKAVESGDRVLLTSACQGLQVDASEEATDLLIKALNKSSSSTASYYICNALATIGNAKARKTLIEARNTGNSTRKRYADTALRSLYSRSPGRQYVSDAQSSDRNEDYKNAEKQYGMAIEVDPELPTAYLGRGNTRLKVNKIAEAREDFERAAELDPYNSHAVTGMSVVMVLEGKIKEGVAHVEAKRSKFANESLYLYNTACVYGRALELITKKTDFADRDKLMPAYRDKALADLKSSIKYGFKDLEWMKKDPDLKSLHGTKEFTEIVDGKSTQK